MAETVTEFYCPIMKKYIDIGYCDEIQMVADDAITPAEDEAHLTPEDFAICKKCLKRIDPTL